MEVFKLPWGHGRLASRCGGIDVRTNGQVHPGVAKQV